MRKMRKYKHKDCGGNLKLNNGKLHVRVFTKFRTKERKEQRYMEKTYECEKCGDKIRPEPDCDHNYVDTGQYMFDHCYICLKCGHMVRYDSSG
jgi:hypothetical protein